MSCSGLLVGLSLLGQVPPPALGAGAARELEAARRSIVANEAGQLKGLAERLAREGDQAAARADSRAAAQAGRAGWPNAVRAAARSGQGPSRGKRRVSRGVRV